MVAWSTGSGTARAVQSTLLEVERQGSAYALYAEMVVDAPPGAVYRLLSDYDRLEQLSTLVKEAELLDSPAEHHHRVHTVAELCVLIFCGEVDQVQDVYEVPGREILALTVPEQSNLEEGVIHWRLQPTESGTRLSVYTRLVPDFWVPPLIGPWAVKRALSSQVVETAENIERLAAKNTGSNSLPETQKNGAGTEG